MPKVKDLGINVIPDTMRPPEIGGGAGCGCTNVTNPCLGCTHNLTVAAQACGCTHVTNPCLGCTTAVTIPHCTHISFCTDCTVQSTSICGGSGVGTIGHCGCTKLSFCTDCTAQATSICGGSGCGCTKFSVCSDCTAQATSICGTSPVGCGGCTNPVTFFQGQACIAATCGMTIGPVITTTPVQQGGGLTMEHVRQLRSQLEQQMQALDEHAKTLGPKTAEEIDKRESELKQELQDLAARRKELK